MKDILLTIIILFFILLGVLFGWMGWIPAILINQLDLMTWWILYVLLFLVGIDLGLNKIWIKLKYASWKMLILPLAVIIGTLTGGLIACLILSYPIGAGLSISSGLGWYTLTSLLLDKLDGPKLAALGFLTNVFREMLTFLLIPIFHRIDKTIAGIAAGGATTMDTTLILIDRVAGPEYAVLAFLQGIICSLLVPILVPFFIKF